MPEGLKLRLGEGTTRYSPFDLGPPLPLRQDCDPFDMVSLFPRGSAAHAVTDLPHGHNW